MEITTNSRNNFSFFLGTLPTLNYLTVKNGNYVRHYSGGHLTIILIMLLLLLIMLLLITTLTNFPDTKFQ